MTAPVWRGMAVSCTSAIIMIILAGHGERSETATAGSVARLGNPLMQMDRPGTTTRVSWRGWALVATGSPPAQGADWSQARTGWDAKPGVARRRVEPERMNFLPHRPSRKTLRRAVSRMRLGVAWRWFCSEKGAGQEFLPRRNLVEVDAGSVRQQCVFRLRKRVVEAIAERKLNIAFHRHHVSPPEMLSRCPFVEAVAVLLHSDVAQRAILIECMRAQFLGAALVFVGQIFDHHVRVLRSQHPMNRRIKLAASLLLDCRFSKVSHRTLHRIIVRTTIGTCTCYYVARPAAR